MTTQQQASRDEKSLRQADCRRNANAFCNEPIEGLLPPPSHFRGRIDHVPILEHVNRIAPIDTQSEAVVAQQTL